MSGTPRSGFFAALAAFMIWGVSPIYFQFLAPATAAEVSLHRALWACAFVGLWLFASRHFSEVRALFANHRVWPLLALSSLLIAFNWYFYAWAVMHEQIAQASLGYYINPLMNVLIGFVFLKERLSRWRWFAVGLATAGVINQIFIVGSVPILALSLAATFALYGLLRKIVHAEAGPGLFVETLILSPFVLVAIFWLESSGQGHGFNSGLVLPLLLAFGGLFTAIPLFLFAYGARRLNLATLGLIQFVAPSLQFALALWYGERFTWSSFATFALIWIGLAIYMWDLRHQMGAK